MPALTLRRLSDSEYRALRFAAALREQSMEQFAREALRAALLRLASTAKGAPLAGLLERS